MNGRHALLSLAALAVTGAAVFGLGPFQTLLSVSPDGTLLDTDPRAPAAIAAWLAALGASGRTCYAAFLAWDTLFLAVHGAALFVLLRVGLGRLAPRLVPIAWLPIAAAALDAVENSLAARLLAAFPSEAPGAAQVLATVTGVKLALVPVCFAAVVATWLAVALRAWAHRRSRRSPGWRETRGRANALAPAGRTAPRCAEGVAHR